MRKRRPPPPPPKRKVVELRHQFAADPFNPLYRYPSDFEDCARAGRQTPLGVLVEIREWCKRYEKEIASTGNERSQRAWSVLIDQLNETLTNEIKEPPND